MPRVVTGSDKNNRACELSPNPRGGGGSVFNQLEKQWIPASDQSRETRDARRGIGHAWFPGNDKTHIISPLFMTSRIIVQWRLNFPAYCFG